MACHSAHVFFLPSLPVTFLWDCPRKELGNDFHFPRVLDNFSVHVLSVNSSYRIIAQGVLVGRDGNTAEIGSVARINKSLHQYCVLPLITGNLHRYMYIFMPKYSPG